MVNMKRRKPAPLAIGEAKSKKKSAYRKVAIWFDKRLRPWKYMSNISIDSYAAKMGYVQSPEEYAKRHGVVTERYLPRNSEIQTIQGPSNTARIFRIRTKTRKREEP